MKKKCYCTVCDYEFTHFINSMTDMEVIKCPKCGRSLKIREDHETRCERNVGIVFEKIISFYYYYYLIFSSLCLISYYLNLVNLVVVFSCFMLVLYIIELCLGFSRNIFGLLGVIVSGIVGYVLTSSVIGILVGISYIFFISGVIKVIYNLVIRGLFRKWG